MTPLRRDSRASARFLEWRLGLFLVGAAIWLTGLIIEQPVLTGAAIVFILAAVVLGLIARSR